MPTERGPAPVHHGAKSMTPLQPAPPSDASFQPVFEPAPHVFDIGSKGWGLQKDGSWSACQIVERRPAQLTAPTAHPIIADTGVSLNASQPLGSLPKSLPGSPRSRPLSPVPLWGAPTSAQSAAAAAAASAAAAALTLGPASAAALTAGAAPAAAAAAAAAAATAATTASSFSAAAPPSLAPAPPASLGSACTAAYDYYIHFDNSNRRLDRWVTASEIKTVLSPHDVSRTVDAPRMAYSPSTGPASTGAGASADGPGTGSLRPQGMGGPVASGSVPGAQPATPRIATRRDRRAQIADDSAHPADATVVALERAREEQTKVRTVDVVQIGKWELDAWYYSPYPEEYANVPKLYVCEWCLKYMRKAETLMKHSAECCPRHPPGTEIYRCGNVSVFEIDGAQQRLYAQCLCLFAKLYIDHKTLFFDVAPFLFYVLTENDDDGCHIVGYFSKEKESSEGYNLACILTFPQHQRKGYGKFLIAFSYALSRIEGCPGSPEKPLSDLGKVSYRSFWSQTLVAALASMPQDQWSLKALSDATGIAADDALLTLQDLHLTRFHRGSHVIVATPRQLEIVARQWARGGDLKVDLSCLHWAPPDKAATEPTAKRRRAGGAAAASSAATPAASGSTGSSSASSGSASAGAGKGGSGSGSSRMPKASPARGAAA